MIHDWELLPYASGPFRIVPVLGGAWRTIVDANGILAVRCVAKPGAIFFSDPDEAEIECRRFNGEK